VRFRPRALDADALRGSRSPLATSAEPDRASNLRFLVAHRGEFIHSSMPRRCRASRRALLGLAVFAVLSISPLAPAASAESRSDLGAANDRAALSAPIVGVATGALRKAPSQGSEDNRDTFAQFFNRSDLDCFDESENEEEEEDERDAAIVGNAVVDWARLLQAISVLACTETVVGSPCPRFLTLLRFRC
jgi:hypothetical protein